MKIDILNHAVLQRYELTQCKVQLIYFRLFPRLQVFLKWLQDVNYQDHNHL